MWGVTAHAGAERVTVDEAVRLALQNNTALQAQQHTIAVAEGDLRQARTFPNNPRLEGEGLTGRAGNGIRQNARKYTVKLSQEIPLGGKWQQRQQIAGAGLERTTWDVQNAQREIVKEVKETFYRILFLEEKRAFADQALELAQQLLHLAEERYRVGESPQLDVNLARVEVQNVQRQRLEVLSQLTQTRATLNRLLVRPPDAPLTVSGTLDAPPHPLDVESLRQQALQQRPDLRSRNAAVEVATGEVALAQAQRVPDVEVAFIFEREETGADIRQTFGGGLAVPLPLWNRNTGRIATEEARQQQAATSLLVTQRSIERQVVEKARAYQTRLSEMANWRADAVPQFKKAAALADRHYRVGAVPIATYVELQKQYLEAVEALLDTKREALEAGQELQRLTGLEFKAVQTVTPDKSPNP